jgi:hypothetical protein
VKLLEEVEGMGDRLDDIFGFVFSGHELGTFYEVGEVLKQIKTHIL